MRKLAALLFLVGSSLYATPIVSMHWIGSLGSPGFFEFTIDGVSRYTLCDEYYPNITTEPYFALMANLSDLTGTTLQTEGDPDALLKYQKVAILASLAYGDSSLASDVTWAMRYIVDSGGKLTSGAQTLLDWVNTQNPANYSTVLSQFVIFAWTSQPGYITPTQEQVGFLQDPNPPSVPEPATMCFIGSGLFALGCGRWLKRRALR